MRTIVFSGKSLHVILRNGLLFLAALFLFSSCTGKAPQPEAGASGLSDVFAEAGLRILREKVSPRTFSVPVVYPIETPAGEVGNLDALKGKVVFLNFWATWCGPCRDEMPSMEVLHRRFKDDGFEILAVNSMETKEEVLAFMKENGLTFPAALDEDGRVNSSYGIQAIPTTFLIDRDGKIMMRLVGSINWDTPQIHTAIETLLKSTL